MVARRNDQGQRGQSWCGSGVGVDGFVVALDGDGALGGVRAALAAGVGDQAFVKVFRDHHQDPLELLSARLARDEGICLGVGRHGYTQQYVMNMGEQ